MKRFRPCLTVLTALLVLLLSTMSVLAADSGLADLPKLSKTEIIDLLQNPQLTDPDNYYEEAPSITAPHTAGVMRQELLDSGLQRLNVVRRLAGLGPVTMNEDFNLLSQKGSVVLAAGKQFTHYPVKPSDMDQAFFDAGYSATTHSNLAYYGYGSTASGVSYLPDPLSWSIDGYMSDSDQYNVEVVGHRRWMIDPRLTQVGMGAAHNYYRDGMWYCTDVYSATYWDVNWMIDADYDFIAWPASGLFPTTNFIIDQNARTPQSDAWSVSLNPDRYQTPSAEDITVTLSGGGKSWTFTDDQTYAVANTGLFFTVDTQSCGEGAAIIFRPDGIDRYEGEYSVSITGLKTRSGQSTELEYSVEFFTPTCLDGHSYTTHTEEATCTTPGSISQICSVCGHTTAAEEIPALGHQWGSGMCKDDSFHTVTCQRTGCGVAETHPHDKQYTTENGVKICTCSGCDLYIVETPALSWSAPGRIQWEAVEGAREYVVLLRDANGNRVGSQRTTGTSMEMFSFMGWYLDNTTQIFSVVVEARDDNDKKFLTLDPGLSVRAEISPDPLPHSCTPSGSNSYTLTAKHPILAGDVLLDTWFTEDGKKSCTRAEFPTGCPMYTSQRTISGEKQQVRLLYDNRLDSNTAWCFTATAVSDTTSEDIADSPADVTLALNSLSDSPVTGLCLVGPGAERKPSAFLVLQNNSAQTLTANVFVAEYDADDTLLNCGVRQVVVQSTQKSSVILHAEDPDTARINVFVLDQTFRALTFKLPASI